ncbi:helicase domain protein [Nitzschia inconspicua]|uniref:Helicase domain protein n=1 Tax=Nitzschia inconspicua TaxID=303405 RepID=A0A9K3K4I0_9STRA|nr:helicase domain protein [Nitzschia inconspicua]KAG7358300.1 helicase domain protein [Nitzschia inconspicua]
MYNKLVAYKKNNGHTLVPYESPEHPGLGFWVVAQRASLDSMVEARKTALDAIGFVWDPFKKAWWDKMFQRFSDMQAKNVCDSNDKVDWKDEELNRWIRTQRQKYRKGTLSKERISML